MERQNIGITMKVVLASLTLESLRDLHPPRVARSTL